MHVKVTCDYCGKELKRRASRIGERNFCSFSCYNAWRNEGHLQDRFVVTCDYCGKKIRKIRSHISDKNYCSKECCCNALIAHNKQKTWNKGLTKITHPSQIKYGLPGDKNPMYKGKITKICETCGKQFKVFLCRATTAQFCSVKCRAIAQKGKPFPGDSILQRQNILKSLIKRPNKAEQKLIDIIEKFCLPFIYTGDGKVMIGNLCPDFISELDNSIIELFGDVFHNPEKTFREKIPYKQTEEGRREIFEKQGYSLLIIWYSELIRLSEKEIVEKIKTFMTH